MKGIGYLILAILGLLLFIMSALVIIEYTKEAWEAWEKCESKYSNQVVPAEYDFSYNFYECTLIDEKGDRITKYIH